MSQFDYYLARVVCINILLVVLVLVGLDRLFAFIAEIDEVGQGQYTMAKLVVIMLLNLPSSFYQMIATAVLLGALLGLGTMADKSELIVARANGMSLYRLARGLWVVGIALLAIVFSIGEWVVPNTQALAARLKLQALSQSISSGGAGGLWLRDDNQYTHIQKILPQFHLQGVNLYRYKDGQLQEHIVAKSAQFDKKNGWVLNHVMRYDIKSSHITVTEQPSYTIQALIDANLLRGLSLKPQMLSAHDLYKSVQYLKSNQLKSDLYELAFWSKFSVPLASLVMLMLALPFVLGSTRSGGAGQRICIGVLIGLGYLLLSQLCSKVGLVLGLHGAIGAFLPILLFACFIAIQIRRLA